MTEVVHAKSARGNSESLCGFAVADAALEAVELGSEGETHRVAGEGVALSTTITCAHCCAILDHARGFRRTRGGQWRPR